MNGKSQISELENGPSSVKAEVENVSDKENVLRAQQTYFANGGDQPQLSEEHSMYFDTILFAA